MTYNVWSGTLSLYTTTTVFCFLVFGCQYQCSRLPGKTRLCNDQYVNRDVKPNMFTHSHVAQMSRNAIFAVC